MEPEFWDKNPNKIPQKNFPEGFHFKPLALNKTRKFYEFILVDTDSVAIKHYKDPKDPSNIIHTTFQILKVLTPSQFGQNPNNTRKFNVQYKFPNWFLQWWDFCGPIEEILPTPPEEGFKVFKSMYNSQNTWILADLKFFSSFSLSWIFSW
uniref:Uncharacterized protein n=1 Tax=Cajanus cajan TaxID=3821 RepID=A0A151UDB0_CAJCA